MSITVVSELHVKSGQEDAFVRIALNQLALPSSTVAGRGTARLFQHLDDSTRLLYVADWESPDAYEAYARSAPRPGTPDQHLAPPTRRYYRRLVSFERMLAPIGVASAVIIDGPPETHLDRREHGLTYHRIVVAQRRGLVLLTLFEAVQDPPGLLMLAGWESMRAFEDAFQNATPKLVDQLVEAGGEARRFLGHVRADTTSF